MTDRTFQIQSGHWHSNDGTHGMSLTIRDEVSGVTMASFQLTPEQSYDMMRGSTFTVEGHHGNRLDWVGKRMVNESHAVPSYVLKDVHYSELADVGKAWAEATLPGWDAYEARRNNSGGVTVVTRKWVELAEETAVCNACGWRGSEDALPEGQVCPKCGLDEVHFFTPGGVQ